MSPLSIIIIILFNVYYVEEIMKNDEVYKVIIVSDHNKSIRKIGGGGVSMIRKIMIEPRKRIVHDHFIACVCV